MPSLRYRSHYGRTSLRLEAMSDSALEALLEKHGSMAGVIREAHRNSSWVHDLYRRRGIEMMPDNRRRKASAIPGALLARVWIESRRNLSVAARRLDMSPDTLRVEMQRRGLVRAVFQSKIHGERRFVAQPGRRSFFFTADFLRRWHLTHKVPFTVIDRKLGIGAGASRRMAHILGVEVRARIVPKGPGTKGRTDPIPNPPADFDLPPAEIERAEMERALRAAADRAERRA